MCQTESKTYNKYLYVYTIILCYSRQNATCIDGNGNRHISCVLPMIKNNKKKKIHKKMDEKKNSITIISMTNWIGIVGHNNINRNGTYTDDDDDFDDEERARCDVCCTVIQKRYYILYRLPGTYRIFSIILYAVIVFH